LGEKTVKERVLWEYLGPHGKIMLKYFLQIGWKGLVQDRDQRWDLEKLRNSQNCGKYPE
jgi:hypothetical protein